MQSYTVSTLYSSENRVMKYLNVYDAVIMEQPLWELNWFIWWIQSGPKCPPTFGSNQSTWAREWERF